MTSASPCLCSSLRQATRLVTRMYDDALRPVGLRITQYSVLAYLAHAGESRVRDLAAALALEETTLTRSLHGLQRSGWVSARPGEDLRERYVTISAEGKRILARARPLWEAAQERLRERLSKTTWDTLFRTLPRVGEATLSS